uniref:ATP synthase subunit b, chloroplastic n=1 Tax=Chlorokybus atmophyticus TaxID=3144 RepID=ATPF_CHLAT|nr:ATP synthase CF0 B subunit [Chlorokybus atmophyticus]Q19VA4.2 RecName: Full=ATP synthase subunit b, chloroplastic; AltName: Full=ATP synthase F(0) sector subunit b; AltName: Full=ATPase subunit I [Chlorokybus atmophyticus]ABD62172.2 CF0 subunit I of ATP synthase [Chlorokybus atmophyticus]WKT05645.1 CF0 subunit I of ATP synthase [Chlorokybus atmophyticus]
MTDILTNMFTIVAELPLGEEEGFAFNGNILETNLINLAAVIGLLFYSGRSFLTNLLRNREDNILKSIRDADERYKEATEKLQQAKNEFEQAKIEADEIRAQSRITAKEIEVSLMGLVSEDTKRLIDMKQATISFEEEKAINEVRRQVIRLALQRALEQSKNRLNHRLQKRVTRLNIGLLGQLVGVND